MSADYSQHRRPINEASKAWADRDGEEWTRDEDDFLVEFWIDVAAVDRDEITVSQCLGRTTESCRVRCEKIRKARGWQMKFTQTTTVEYRGLMDDPEDCFWSPDYYTNGK